MSIGAPHIAETPEEIAAITDPAERARLATALLAEHQSAVTRLAHIRREAIAELRASGHSYAQVAAQLGVTRGRVAQLTAPSTIEREFFGGPTVTIATPLRVTEQDRPLVAQEDLEAAMTLVRFLNSAAIPTEFAHTAPSGELDLTPPALVAICGPKSSPTIARLIDDEDPAYQYAPDDEGHWQITSKATGETLKSPIDEEPNADADLAYVARLNRPDDGEPMLVIAGIHAIGSLGAIAYLTNTTSLRELHRAVGGQPFSTLIRSTFSRSPLAIRSAVAVTEPIVHA